MSTDLRATSIPQSNQTSTDSDSVVRGSDSQARAKASVFHIQTGIRAGGPAAANAAREAIRGAYGKPTY